MNVTANMNLTANWVVFVLYCIAMLTIGWIGNMRTKNSDDFYVAGRSFGLKVAIPLFAAAFVSSATMIGYTQFAYDNGWMLLLFYGCNLALGWVLLQLFIPKLYSAKARWYTTSDLYSARFEDEKFMRPVIGFYNMVQMALFVIIGLMGVGVVLEVFLNVPYRIILLVVGIVFILYTALGGMFSVAWTNVVQFIFLATAVVSVAVFVLFKVGGVGVINEYLQTFSRDGLPEGFMMTATSGGRFPALRIIGYILGAANIPCLVYYHRIIFSVDSKKTALGMIGFAVPFLILVYLGVTIIGLGGRILLPNLANSSQVFPQIVTLLPTSLCVIAVAGLVSAIQSTIDSQLLSASSCFVNDVYPRLSKKPLEGKKLLHFHNGSTILVGLLCLLFATTRPAGLMDIYNLIIMMGPCIIFPSLTMGLFWKGTTRLAARISVLFGAVAGGYWHFFGNPNIPATVVILPISFLMIYIISKSSAGVSQQTLSKFFNDVPEVPGA